MSMNKQLLDPLGSLCKLVALNFNEINTKITIHKHSIQLDPPNNYQFVMRYINGDGRENISELFYVIVRVIKWYLDSKNEEIINNKKDCNEENWMLISQSDEIKKLIKYACCALRKLQETYEYGNVILAAQFYINIMEDAINNLYKDSKLPKYILEREREYENLLDYEKLKNFWDFKKLKRISDLYDNCFTVYYDSDMEMVEKEALIEGYLRSIGSILQLSDNDFKKLIQNSNKG